MDQALMNYFMHFVAKKSGAILQLMKVGKFTI